MRALIIGQLGGHFSSLFKILKENSMEVVQVANLSEIKKAFDGNANTIFFDDDTMIQDLVSMKKESSLRIIICGANKSLSEVEKAIKMGVDHFLPLPPDFQITSLIIQKENQDKKLLFKSKKMLEVVETANKISNSDAPVLITGESGTGKELLAKLIHEKSHRKNAPFVAVNCAAIPEKLLESELFGYERGAFTGASMRRIGIFERAKSGTLLLDEISEMDIHLQAKILRTLQEKEIVRIGGHSPIKTDAKILSTCNVNLEEMTAQGEFRQDLFFRLSVIQIHIPPLRIRKEDIPLLANHFAKNFCQANSLAPKIISKNAMNQLLNHTWKGNVRELENCIHRSVLLEDGEMITGKYFELQKTNDMAINLENQTIKQIEKKATLSTLQDCSGNKTKTAQILGISIRTLRNKLNQYNREQ